MGSTRYTHVENRTCTLGISSERFNHWSSSPNAQPLNLKLSLVQTACLYVYSTDQRINSSSEIQDSITMNYIHLVPINIWGKYLTIVFH